MLVVEVEGVEYEKGRQGNPILPIFKTAEPSLDLIDAIYTDLVPGEACVTNGPVFCDYNTSSKVIDTAGEPLPEPSEESPEDVIRTWIRTDGKTMEAEFVSIVGDKAVLKNSRGRQKKVPLAQLSQADREFIELTHPPEFIIDFTKQSSQKFFIESPEIPGWTPDHLDYVFTTKLKQSSSGVYNHELNVEFFAVGKEIDGNNYVLFDRKENSFVPASAVGRSHSFSGDAVPVRSFEVDGWIDRRGVKYGGYLVVVTDKRGKIIDHGTSNKWLLDILDELRKFPIGRHFDKSGTRVFPPRPKPLFY